MIRSGLIRGLVPAVGCLAHTVTALAQPVGTFSWQLEPFCNRIAASVTQNGGVYTLDGYDDQCGAGRRAPLVGLATPNPDGTIGLGLSIVTVPGGAPVHVDARITLPSASGQWSDSTGNSGLLVLNGTGSGTARPLPTGGTPWGSVISAPDSPTVSGLILKRPSSPGTFDASGLVVEWGPRAAFLAPPSSAIFATSASGVGVAAVSDTSTAVAGSSASGVGVGGLTGTGRAVAGASLTTGVGVHGVSAAGVGVLAEATASGPALEVMGGAIKVSGTIRPAFQHVAKASNITGNQTVIDHPLTNGDPNALLFITHVFVSGVGVYDTRANSVWYNEVVGRWTIYHDDLSAMAPDARFNVLVVKR